MNGKQAKDGLTYQALIQLIKKSFLRIIVYVLIAAFVAGALGILIIMLNKKEATFNAMIEYNYDGAEKGLDPQGSRLDVSKVKSDAIVTKALIDNNFTEEERGKIKTKIISNITIAGVVPEDVMNKILIIKEIATKTPTQLNELNQLSYFSTSYVISLKNDKELNLTSTQCNNILNSIVDNYISDFKNKYGFKNVLGTLLGNGISHSSYDYIELHSIYEDQLKNIVNYLNSMISISSTFRSVENQMSFEDLKARVQAISDYDLNQLEIYIYEKGVSKKDALINAKTYINEKIIEIDRVVVSTTEALSATNQAIADFIFVYNTTYTEKNTTTQVLANGNAYDKLQDEARKYQTRLVDLNSSKALWESRNTKITNAAAMTDEEKQEAIAISENMLSDINANVKVQIDNIDQAVREYIEREVMKNGIAKTLSSVKVEADNDNWKILAIAELLVIFVAALVAIFVTNSKQNKQNTVASVEMTEKEEDKK
jgi:hypothetical protein